MTKEFQFGKIRATTCLGKLEIRAGLDQKLPDNTNLPWFQPIGDISRVGAKAASRSKATLTPTIQATSKPSLVLSGTEMAVVDLRSYLLVLFWTSLMVVYAKFEPSPSCLPPSFSLGTWKQITPAHTCSWLDICKSFWSSCYSMAAVQCPVSTSKNFTWLYDEKCHLIFASREWKWPSWDAVAWGSPIGCYPWSSGNASWHTL